MAYESPIEIIQREATDWFETNVIKACVSVGINVNRDRLIRALQFDRNQYNAGYADGYNASRWIPVSERPPEDLEEVNITFTNLEPESYYEFIKGKRFTGSAVFYKGEWYWYSSITVDVLKEYGRYESEKIDKGIKIIAWQQLPEPYKEDQG